MKVYVTQQTHGNYKYLLNWANPDAGYMMGDWFRDLKELREYIYGWNAKIIFLKPTTSPGE